MILKRLSVCLGLKYSLAEYYNIKLVLGLKDNFKEVINSVLVKVKGLSFLVFFFVLEDTYYYCILGQPFMMLTALAFKTTKYQIDRLQYTTLKDLSLMCFVQVKCV